MPYQIAETATFERSLEKSSSPFEGRLIREHLGKRIYPQLRHEPHFGPHIKRLRDFDPPTWRYRIAHFRLFYCIDESAKMVVIGAMRHRKEVYR